MKSKIFVMRKGGIWLSIVLGVGFMLMATVFSYSQETMDAYLRAFENGITTQNSIEKANINGNLTRQAMAKMIVNFSKNILKTAQVKNSNKNACNFKDKTNITSDLKSSVEEACKLGLMGQGVEFFDPKDTLTRAQFGTILSRALWGDTYDGGEPYYEKHLKALKDAGIMNNIDNPNVKEKRGNVMIMLMRGENLIKDFSKRDKQKSTKTGEKVELSAGKGVVWDKSKGTLTLTYKKKSITMMDKNLGAKDVGVGETSIGHLFVWGNNKGYYFDDSKNGTGFLSVKEGTWSEGAKGPCPKGYHIPTQSEWQTAIEIWRSNNPSIKGKGMGKQFSEDLFLPAIGTRQEAAWRAEGNAELGAPHQAYYWVSTPNRLLTGTVNTGNSHLYLSFDTKPIFGGTGEPEIGGVITNGNNLETAIRCFAGEAKTEKKSSSTTTKKSTKSTKSDSLTITSEPEKEDSILPKFSFYF